MAFAVEDKKPGAKGKAEIKQKYDGSSTAKQILLGRDLSGQYAVVTGANSGIGELHKSRMTHVSLAE